MLGKTHIIYIGLLRAGIRQNYRVIPEMETIDSVVTLCHCKERFTVVSLHTDYEIIFSIKLDGSGIHHCVDAETFLEIRICFFIQIVSPVYRCKLSGKYRIFVAVIDSVVPLCFLVFSGNQSVHFFFFNIILFMQCLSSS